MNKKLVKVIKQNPLIIKRNSNNNLLTGDIVIKNFGYNCGKIIIILYPLVNGNYITMRTNKTIFDKISISNKKLLTKTGFFHIIYKIIFENFSLCIFLTKNLLYIKKISKFFKDLLYRIKINKKNKRIIKNKKKNNSIWSMYEKVYLLKLCLNYIFLKIRPRY
ncbi:hypothetical protein M951_chr396 (nucleomorph) [Lotharella oceanica]|uniref:Ribosomal protein L14 n=1 Tax=Lotharella oceanica TaxID=641309 RepID=A0A060DBY1_9EUKA|nr:hypothetical protein M951_chr396 [Lotharella oceanica]